MRRVTGNRDVWMDQFRTCLAVDGLRVRQFATVGFVRFMVKHPVSGPHAIGPIKLVV
jgi:hypothetical protein